MFEIILVSVSMRKGDDEVRERGKSGTALGLPLDALFGQGLPVGTSGLVALWKECDGTNTVCVVQERCDVRSHAEGRNGGEGGREGPGGRPGKGQHLTYPWKPLVRRVKDVKALLRTALLPTDVHMLMLLVTAVLDRVCAWKGEGLAVANGKQGGPSE